jgi:phage minor structural protein
MGSNRGMYFSNELRLQLLKKQSQSYDFTTVLFPVGKDNLSIASVNNGRNTIENFQYCGKYLPQYYVQKDVTEAQQLKMMAEAYLAYYSTPITGYALSLSGLPQDVQLGDDIILVDKIKRTKQKQRIKKIYRYPFEPEKDKVELSNAIVNFADTLTKFQTDTDRQIEYIKNNLTTLE